MRTPWGIAASAAYTKRPTPGKLGILWHGRVAGAAPASRQRRRIAGRRQQDVPVACRRLIDGEIGPAVPVVVALHRHVAGAAPAHVDGRGVASARLQPVPQTARAVVDDEVGLAIVIVVALDRDVAGAAEAFR